jgi:PilZ domain-containing protein
MTEFQERRRGVRAPIPEPMSIRARATLEVRLLDLSPIGARIGHLDLLHPGLPCVLTLPSSLGPLVLTGSIVHSRVTGIHNDSAGARYPHYESGIEFTDVTPDRQTVLTDVLARLTLEGMENGHLQVEGNEAPDSGKVGVS